MGRTGFIGRENRVGLSFSWLLLAGRQVVLSFQSLLLHLNCLWLLLLLLLLLLQDRRSVPAAS